MKTSFKHINNTFSNDSTINNSWTATHVCTFDVKHVVQRLNLDAREVDE